MTVTILIADDDPHIREVIDYALSNAGHSVTHAQDGVEAMARFEAGVPDLIVLDVGMPELDGLEVCRRVRRTSQVPILFLSARDEEVDRIVGLEIGGDDYVTKPFSPRELVARVSAILKRTGNVREAIDDAKFEHGSLMLDTNSQECRVLGAAVSLTTTEFEILKMLMRRPGVVFTRSQVLEQAWPANIHVSDRTIDSHVRNLRAKLKAAGCEDAIGTVHGRGFKLGACEAKA